MSIASQIAEAGMTNLVLGLAGAGLAFGAVASGYQKGKEGQQKLQEVNQALLGLGKVTGNPQLPESSR
jgi:hypothetical protein